MKAGVTLQNGLGVFVFTAGDHSFAVRGPITTPVERMVFRSHIVRKTRGVCEDCRHGLRDMVDAALEEAFDGSPYA
jgi:hypothetical protein